MELFTITISDTSSLNSLSPGIREKAKSFIKILYWLPYVEATIAYNSAINKFSLHHVMYPKILTQFDRNAIHYYTLRDQLIADGHTGKFALINSDKSVLIFERPSLALASKTDKDGAVIHIGYEGESVLTYFE